MVKTDRKQRRQERKQKREKEDIGSKSKKQEKELTKKVEKIIEIRKLLNLDEEDIEFSNLDKNEIDLLYDKLMKPTWITNLPEDSRKKIFTEFAKTFIGNMVEEHDGPLLSLLKEAGSGKNFKGGLFKNLLK